MKAILHVVDIKHARLLFFLVEEVSLRVAIAVASPERGCSHFLAVVRANCDGGELGRPGVRLVVGLQVEVLTTSNAKPVLVVGRGKIYPGVLAAVDAFDRLDFVIVQRRASCQVPADRVWVLFCELIAVVDDTAVVVGAVVNRLHGAIGVRPNAFLGVDLDCSGFSARLKVERRGH